MRISVPLQLIGLDDDGFHFLVDIALFNKPFKVVLDTGASKTAFDKTVFEQASENALLTISEKLSTGLGTNTMESFTATITDMQVGRLQIAEFEVAVLDLSTINIAYAQMGYPQVLGVLGSDILLRYKAVIDYGRQTISFKTKKPRLKQGK